MKEDINLEKITDNWSALSLCANPATTTLTDDVVVPVGGWCGSDERGLGD
jgi:hypothetical protein